MPTNSSSLPLKKRPLRSVEEQNTGEKVEIVENRNQRYTRCHSINQILYGNKSNCNSNEPKQPNERNPYTNLINTAENIQYSNNLEEQKIPIQKTQQLQVPGYKISTENLICVAPYGVGNSYRPIQENFITSESIISKNNGKDVSVQVSVDDLGSNQQKKENHCIKICSQKKKELSRIISNIATNHQNSCKEKKLNDDLTDQNITEKQINYDQNSIEIKENQNISNVQCKETDVLNNCKLDCEEEIKNVTESQKNITNDDSITNLSKEILNVSNYEYDSEEELNNIANNFQNISDEKTQNMNRERPKISLEHKNNYNSEDTEEKHSTEDKNSLESDKQNKDSNLEPKIPYDSKYKYITINELTQKEFVRILNDCEHRSAKIIIDDIIRHQRAKKIVEKTSEPEKPYQNNSETETASDEYETCSSPGVSSKEKYFQYLDSLNPSTDIPCKKNHESFSFSSHQNSGIFIMTKKMDEYEEITIREDIYGLLLERKHNNGKFIADKLLEKINSHNRQQEKKENFNQEAKSEKKSQPEMPYVTGKKRKTSQSTHQRKKKRLHWQKQKERRRQRRRRQRRRKRIQKRREILQRQKLTWKYLTKHIRFCQKQENQQYQQRIRLQNRQERGPDHRNLQFQHLRDQSETETVPSQIIVRRDYCKASTSCGILKKLDKSIFVKVRTKYCVVYKKWRRMCDEINVSLVFRVKLLLMIGDFECEINGLVDLINYNHILRRRRQINEIGRCILFFIQKSIGFYVSDLNFRINNICKDNYFFILYNKNKYLIKIT